MRANLTQIAAACDRNVDTVSRQLKKFIQEGKFKKTSPGKQFNEKEITKLEKLFDFKYRELK